MRPLKQILLVIASIAGLSTSARAAPTEADVAAVRTYIEQNRAYSDAARAEALRETEALPGLIATPARFELAAAHIAALADNGHSALLPPQWASRYPRSPVRLGLFADGLYVIAAPPADAALLGRRVVSINGRPWQEVRSAYARYQGGLQSFRDQFVTLFMEMPALLAAAGLGSDPDHLLLTFAPVPGQPPGATIAPALAPYEGMAAFVGRPALLDGVALIPAGSLPLYLRDPDQPSRILFPDGFDGAYIQLKEIRGFGFDAFLAEARTALQARHPRNIVVDLRFNMGGDLNLARDFMAALPGLAQGGRIYAITSGRTFSAAISSLGYLKQAAGDRLTIVGEPIGDRLEFWAEGNLVQLPGLGAILLTATERHNYMTGCPEPDCHASIRDHPIRVTSLQPDLPTPLSFADYAAGRDPAMEAIRLDIGRRGSR